MSSASQQASDQDVVPEETEADADQAAPTDAEETQPEEESSSQLPLDHVFEILKNERRRTVLHYLREHGGTVALGELAEHVAAVENGTTVAQVTSNERKCVYVGLYQCHLPKMDDMDIVEFNQNRGRISLGPNAAQLFEYLEESDEVDPALAAVLRIADRRRCRVARREPARCRRRRTDGDRRLDGRPARSRRRRFGADARPALG
ncbi:DUF7344 domain-containing protein [Halosimplex amylolyticum]|uniref:DUF7344 domain-containing protein n=1 Tax=Halosimplex amylolyticum TaxID=3396616 RepID=UPI003F57E63C